MALSTYTMPNNNGDATSMTAIDSAVASAPGDRPSTFTPTGGYVVPTSFAQSSFGSAGSDYGVGSAPSKRAQCFEPPSFTASIDPGLAVSG